MLCISMGSDRAMELLWRSFSGSEDDELHVRLAAVRAEAVDC